MLLWFRIGKWNQEKNKPQPVLLPIIWDACEGCMEALVRPSKSCWTISLKFNNTQGSSWNLHPLGPVQNCKILDCVSFLLPPSREVGSFFQEGKVGFIHVSGFYSPSALAGAGPSLVVALEYSWIFNEKSVELMGGLVATVDFVEMWKGANPKLPFRWSGAGVTTFYFRGSK